MLGALPWLEPAKRYKMCNHPGTWIPARWVTCLVIISIANQIVQHMSNIRQTNRHLRLITMAEF